MSIQELPNNVTVTGTVEVVHVLKDDGDTGISLGVDGVSDYEALGMLEAAIDRLKEEISYRWTSCPGCGLPWSDHDDPEDE